MIKQIALLATLLIAAGCAQRSSDQRVSMRDDGTSYTGTTYSDTTYRGTTDPSIATSSDFDNTSKGAGSRALKGNEEGTVVVNTEPAGAAVVTGETESQNSKGAGARSLTGETTATTTTIEPVTSATVAVNTDAGAANSQGDGARVLTGTTETTENVQNDAAFVRTAAQAGLAEVKMGQLAQQNAGNQAVKDFGQKLVTDHSKANDELMQIASRKNLQAPAEMSAKDNEMIQHLSTLNGTEFDKACGRHAVTAHEKAVKLFKTEAQSGQDPELKAFAQKTLPTLEEHLRVAKQLNVGAKEE